MGGRPMDRASYPPTGTGMGGEVSERTGNWWLTIVTPPPPRIAVDAV